MRPSKSGQSYVIAATSEAPLDRILLQLGAPDAIEEQTHLQSWRERRGVDWLGQIAPFASEAELRATGGVALTAMSPELQTRLRHPIELPAAARLAQAYAKAVPLALEANKLRILVQSFGKTAPGKEASAPSTVINLVDSAGKPVATIARVAPVERATP